MLLIIGGCIMNNNNVNFSKDIDITNLDKHIELINSHIDMFSDYFKDALTNLVKCGKVIYKQNKGDIELNHIINQINNGTVVWLNVHGNINMYVPFIDAVGLWDLLCLDDVEHDDACYGVGMDSVEELREILKEDFKSGIITMISVGGQTIYNNMTDIS
jgi:hypothetical protein